MGTGRTRPSTASRSGSSASCFGLIGANGAGKTTLLRILATLMRPLAGTATIDGHDVVAARREVRRRIGYMPERYTLYPELTLEELLDYTAASYGLRRREKQRRVGEALEMVGLGSRRRSSCAELSHGMKQRAFLARALVHDPAVLLLDEPSSGLDPMARVELRRVLGDLTRIGKTIVISSHVLPELEETCDTVAILGKGRVVAAGAVADLRCAGAAGHETVVEVDGGSGPAEAVLRECPGVVAVEAVGGTLHVRHTGKDAFHEMLRALVLAGIRVTSLGDRPGSLEQRLMEVSDAA
ncbi:MAG: ABC transporter ATP-binding protein [Acidobacteriota bacterium]